MANFLTTLTNRRFVPALLLACAAAIVFLPGLFNGFAFDDKPRLVNNPGIRELGNLRYFFTQPSWPGDLYRPLEALSFALTYALFGLNLIPFHLTNILLHVGATLMLYLMLRRICGGQISFVASLLFAVHAVHVEPVAVISYRTELMAALAGFASVWAAGVAFDRTEQKSQLKWINFHAALLFLAVLSKESAVCFLLITPAYLFIGRPAGAEKPSWRRILTLSYSTWLAFGAYLIIRGFVLGSVTAIQNIPALDNPLVGQPVTDRVLTALALLGRYISLCVEPWPLSATYSYAKILTIQHWELHQIISYSALVLALGALTLLLLRRRHPAAFGGMLFFFSFAITSNIFFLIGTIFAERLVYVGSAGICLLLAYGLLAVPHPRVAFGLLAAVLLNYALLTVTELPRWKDDRTRFFREIQVSPESAIAQNNYAYQQFLLGNYNTAIFHFHQALRIYPKNDQSVRGLVYSFQRMNDLKNALFWAKKSVEREPRNDSMWAALAEILTQDRQVAAAQQAAAKAVAINPQNQTAKRILAGAQTR